MQHTNTYQCLDSIRQRLEYLETEVIKRDKANRESTALMQAAENTINKLEERLANLQVDYAYVQAELDKSKPEPKPAKIYTTRLFWDCNCETEYIQPRWLKECKLCKAKKDDQPDSRLSELPDLELANLNHYADQYIYGGK